MTAGPVGPRLEHRLVPDLGLRARVGEHQRGGAWLDVRDHLRQHLQAQVAGPGESAPCAAGSSVSMTVAWASLPCTSTAAALAGVPSSECHGLLRLPSVADMPQTHSPGSIAAAAPAPAAPARRACCSSSSCHSSTTTMRTRPSTSRCIGAGQHQRQALGRGDQHRGQALGLRAALRGAGVAGAQAQCPRAQTGHALVQRGSESCSVRSVSAASARIGVSHNTVSGAGPRPAASRVENACKAPARRHRSCPRRCSHATGPTGPPATARHTVR
jgi:hypothetical protein